ncbi:MaoC/PaaZ C-terminal domain-containing protein [Rhodococcus opacus]|uniref:MaoC/PaaZ C-terminal domain-containing protein n=1 Tax=Rhodococcus opacus TaxID=37919 RepID=UPI0027B95E07|nr:MaoC/PaaZ C-terminal domain-containing protein [Rhodococcus opacus]
MLVHMRITPERRFREPEEPWTRPRSGCSSLPSAQHRLFDWERFGESGCRARHGGRATPRLQFAAGEVTRRSGTNLAHHEVTVDAANAVIYTECARIWNPIHVDIRVAHAAGLPGTVLHGAETLARAVPAISRAGARPEGRWSPVSAACRRPAVRELSILDALHPQPLQMEFVNVDLGAIPLRRQGSRRHRSPSGGCPDSGCRRRHRC